MKEGEWVNGGRRLSGFWHYDWPSGTFFIRLNQKDRITGENKEIQTKGESPEWGNWRLERKKWET